MKDEIQIDVATMNAVLKLLEAEIQKYTPDSPESIAVEEPSDDPSRIG